MAGSKGRATAYSDFYKQNTDTPDDNYGDQINKSKMPMRRPMFSMTINMDHKEEDMATADKRKAAIRRRLMKRQGK